MALRLAPYFEVFAAVREIFHPVAWAVEQWVRLWAAFDRARFAWAWTDWHLVARDDFRQLRDQLHLLLAAEGLSDRDTELPSCSHGDVEAQAFPRPVINGPASTIKARMRL